MIWVDYARSFSHPKDLGLIQVRRLQPQEVKMIFTTHLLNVRLESVIISKHLQSTSENVLDTGLNVPQVVTHLPCQQLSGIITPLLQMKKLRHNNLSKIIRCYPAEL